MRYKNVLLVTDLREDSDIVASRAKCMLEGTAVRAVAHIACVYAEAADVVELRALVVETQRDALVLLVGIGLDVVADDAHVETALSTRRGILDYCEKIKPDLVVIGRHVRTGLASLLGATADDILPGVNCDVLVVKLGEPV